MAIVRGLCGRTAAGDRPGVPARIACPSLCERLAFKLAEHAMMPEQSQTQLQAAYSEAFALIRTGRAATAEYRLRAIQAAAPGEVNSLHLLGVALLYQDKVTEAIEFLERAVASRPNFWQGRP